MSSYHNSCVIGSHPSSYSEIMLCSFTDGLSAVSLVNLPNTPAFHFHFQPVPKTNGSAVSSNSSPPAHTKAFLAHAQFAIVPAGARVERFPGDLRTKLDYSRFVSFYDLSLAPSLTGVRERQERWFHRLNTLSQTDSAQVMRRIETLLRGAEHERHRLADAVEGHRRSLRGASGPHTTAGEYLFRRRGNEATGQSNASSGPNTNDAPTSHTSYSSAFVFCIFFDGRLWLGLGEASVSAMRYNIRTRYHDEQRTYAMSLCV